MTLRMMKTLIQREYWENYHLLYRLPLWLGVIITVIIYAVSGLSYSRHLHVHGHYFGQMNMPAKHAAIHLATSANDMVPLFCIFLWITLFTYALRTLFTDRKDGSIFFWNSMPTPPWTIVVSKIITLFVIAPMCSWVFLTITQWLIYLAIVVGHFGLFSHSFSFSTFIIHAFSSMFDNLYRLWFVGLWLAPILGLCFISSSFSKRSPAVAVFVSVFIICILDLLFTKDRTIATSVMRCFEYSINGDKHLFHVIKHHGLFAPDTERFILGLILGAIGFVIAAVIRSKNLDFRND